MTEPDIPAAPNWTDAACRGYPTDWWFPQRREPHPYNQARPICDICTIRTTCLEYACHLPENPHGMWGGLTPNGREQLRRQIWGRSAAWQDHITTRKQRTK